MSDKVSYTKHLTATEAEFENFQANSICEEEFITLSDLVSPQDQLELPESGLENSDIGENLPYEQNVVYDDLPLSVETIEFSADNTINKTWLENPTPTTQHLSSVESIKRPHFKIQGEGCSNKSEFIKKSINAVTKSGRGRGRGSRGPRGKGRGGPSGRGRGRPSGRGRGRPSGRGRGEKGQKILNVDTFVEKTAPSPSLSNETIEQTSSANPGANVTSTMNNLTDCEKKRKRGRPKSVIQNGTTTTSVAEIKSCDDLLRKDIKGTKIKMRGRKGKACRMEENISPINVNTEDVTNTENTNKNKQLINDHNEITLQNDIIDSSSCFVQKEPLKKKGRKSKTCRTEEKFSEINVNTEVATDTATSNKKKQLINNEIALQTHDIDSSSIFLANEAMVESNHNDDDICLSKIKSQLKSKNESGKNDLQSKESSNNVHDILTETFPSKTSSLLDESANSNVPKESDKLEMEQLTTSPIIMDSKRSSRNRNKPIFKYDESESEEEDPFANIELSDDEPNKKKNGKCNIDYEYLPYGKQQTKSSSDSDDIHNKDEGKSARKRKFNIFDKNGKIRSPKKKRRQKLCNANELKTDPADIEDSLKSSVVLKNCQDDITDFLAKKIQGTDIKIFKANSTVTSQNTFEIPIIDPNKPKKCVEISTQTNTLNVTSAGVQTDAQYDRGTMKQVTLSSVQANKACDFLKNIVSTTAELGELMTLKSQEFISKKINTENVTDTLKMDYCVKKSFQLFKLAMHNLLQMEDELSNQYEEFLKINNLLQYRQKQREITPKPKDDSDCEIVEVPHVQPKQSTSKVKAVFNPRTVFLNKELSIKIAKKAQEIPKQHKDNIIAKGKRTVWLNDSVMVKKVKPTQSFLALDSLKKKPPDCVTLDMVKKFFREYTKQKMLLICKKLNSIEWLHCYQEVICNYFIKESSTKMTEHSYSSTSDCQIKMSTKSDVFVRKQILTNPKTLFTLCVESFQSQSHATNPKKLFTLCVESFQKGTQLHGPKASFNPQCFQKSSYDPQPLLATCIKVLNKNFKCENEIKTSGIQQENQSMAAILQIANVKTLQFLCLLNLNKLMINVKPSDVEYIASKEKSSMKLEAKSLSTLCFLKIKDFYQPHKVAKNVKTLSFICLQVIDKLLLRQHVTNSQNKKTRHTEKSKEMAFSLDEAVTIDNVNCYVSHADLEEYTNFEDNSESHYADQDIEETSWVSKVKLQDLHFGGQYTLQSDDQEISSNIICNIYSRTSKIEQIKIEPLDESETITALEVVKVEPADAPDNDAAIVPSSSILTKEELELEQNLEHIISNEELVLCSYDVNHFESFVQSHKMIKDISTSYYMSQSDEIFSQSSQRIRKQYDPDSDEENINSMDRMGLLVPQNVEQAKDDLLENSSNDGDTQTHKSVKKKPIRSKSGKKITKDLSSTKEKHLMVNEVKRLTKKMKGRRRQEEKRNVNCDSDSDTPLLPRKKRQSEIHVETMANKSETENINDPSSSHTLISDKEIQCNDVDSTECMDTRDTPRLLVAEQKQENSNKIQEDREVPSTLIECEPDIFIRNSDILSENGKVTNKNKWKSISQRNLKHMQIKPKYIERSGWYCYNIDHTDSKLYDQVSIVLEKLPESFVQTYNRFQGLHHRTDDDTEVDRLVNLNSLHRSLTKDKDPGKCKEICSFKKRRKMTSEQEDIVNNEHFAELTPSEDENEKFDVPVVQETDNCLAKNLLLGEIESDSEEVNQSSQCVVVKDEPRILQKYLIAKSENENTSDVSDVFLTADIMMNKELALLHTAVTPNEEVEPTDSKDLLTTKNPPRTGLHKQRQVNKDDPCEDSSSEEEKQWVNTKEKLLKRLERKQEDTHGDEARGAKRVSEFIEKCGDGPEVRPRPLRCRSKRSHKKKLEKRKQMNFLVEERSLESGAGKRTSQAYGRGRRNIRKVIDKKSLQRDTVKANMQEFERKQQLAHRLRELRERLGCEDAVNVVVINGELCLQYDVERNAPVASVHAHFTGVMKAHQYEGVKFMWDACFETVERVSEGHPGSGCILAHCMGLGKTLQVLALLHTVLTHPTLKMRRVLVCCPLSTVLNWVDEIHKWMGPVTDEIKVFELSKFKKTYERAYQLEDWYSGGGIFIIGYELFRTLTTLHPELDDVRPSIIKKIRTALLDPGPDVIVCDEGHLLKNDSSVLALAMNRVSTNRRIVLTGTPMQNNLREYYCMVNFIKPHLLGTYHEFSNRFENPIMNGQHRDSREDDIRLMKTRTHILHKVLEGCLQRQEASVLHPYLPKKYEYTVFIPLTECQKNMYKHYLDAFGAKGQQMLLKDFHTLQKIWTHPQVLHNFQTKSREEKYKKIKVEKLEDDLAHEDITASEDAKPAPAEVWWLQYLQGGNTMDSLHSSSKFQVVFNLLDECVALGDKILIFSTSLFTMDTLEYFLRSIKKWSLGHDYYRLDGSVPAEVRQKWCREFNSPQNHRTKLFLISTRAGSLGLNMTAANRVIILDTSWNPAHDIQSIFRVYRFGQKKDCFIYRLVAMGTMEQKMYERSVSKQAVSCRVVDEQQIDRHYNSAELTELYSWDEEGWGILAGIAPGVRDPALLRVAAAGAVHAVREHDSMLRGSEPALPEDERAAAWQQFQLEHAEGHRAHAVVAAKSLDDANRETDAKRFADTGKAPASTEPKAGASEHLAMDSPQDVEHGLVKKIMQILISHKFHETAKPDEVIDLVANIKRLVISGMSGEISRDEPVAASIAAVLLKDLKPAPASPPPPVVSSGARRGLREVRRAALAAERTFEILNDECSTPGDDVDWEAGDERKRKPKKPPKEVPPPVASCIVISDDEIEAPRLLAQEKKNTVKTYSRRIKMKVKESSIEKNKIATARGSDDAEAVPLHASLLTDVNFVKIVAHTYLKGNPMLAEDAALMAARYSTDKALKELQASGVPITAGPIYDIAISVLGKALLEKMHQSNGPSTDTSDVGSSASSLFRDAQAHTHVITDDEGDSQMAISKETSRKKTFAGPRSRKPQVEKKLQPKGTENPANSRRISNNVFPVSNCIGPGNPAESSRQVEECILPDDDDVIVASPHPTSSIPTPTPVSLLRSARPTLLVGHQSSKLLPSTSTSSDTYASTHTTAVGGVPATHRGDAGGKATSDVGAGSVTESILPESEPICLSDSDDEPTPSGPAPLLVHSASFKANTPFVLPPVVRSSLEPKKKYMYIPLLPSPYPTSNDTVPGVNAQSAPSSANSFLTSSGPMKVQCSASAPSHPRAYGEGTRTKRTAADLVVINDHGESKAKKKTSGGVRARPLGTNLPQNCVANADVPQVQTLDEDSLPTATPDDDPLSILKNVVHIQAPRWDTVEAKRADEQGVPKKPPTKPIVIQRNLHGEGSSKLKSFIAKKTPAPIGTQAKGQPETKTHILELLKRLEKAKWANANFKSSLKIQPKSEKVAAGPSRAPQTAARAAPKRQLNSFIDLTERQPTGSSRVDDRGGASSCSKREVKKPKRLLTLADFNLDDLSEITELE